MRRDVLQEIEIFVAIVEERIEIAGIVRRQRKGVRRLVVDDDVGIEGQGVGVRVESGDRDAVAEHVMDPAQRSRLRRDLELGKEQPQVMAVARAHHDAVLAERDRATHSDIRSCGERGAAASSGNHRDFTGINL